MNTDEMQSVAALNEVTEMRGFDTVVHLAAVPNPRILPGPEVFRINALGTYNIFEAAAAEGIKKLVQASSINAFGCFWGNTDIIPRYLPIDRGGLAALQGRELLSECTAYIQK